jgi:hypothetical protein
MEARPLGAWRVSSTSSWSSGGRSGYFEAVGRCLSLTLGFFGTQFRNPFFVGSLVYADYLYG